MEDAAIDYAFKSDGCSIVADLDQKWICILHDWTFYLGGPPSAFFAANARFYRLIRKYSKHRWLAPIRWFGVTAFAWGWLPHRARWGFGWKFPATQGDVHAGEFTVATEEPAFEKAMRKAKAPPEVMRALFANGWR